MNTDIRDLVKLVKVKDPRNVWAVASLIVAIVAFALVSRLLVMSIIERDILQEDLNATNARIAQLQGMQGANPEVLQQRLVEHRTELSEVLAGFPTLQQVDEEIGRYYQYAGELGTQLVRMEAMLNAPEETVSSGYRVQRFLLGVRGEVPQLLRFLGRISNVPYRGIVVDNITIRPDDDASTGAALANADLAVYPVDVATDAVPIPEQAALAPTDPMQPTDNIDEIEALMRRAIADQDWAAAVAHGRHILHLAPDRDDIAQALYQAHVDWARVLASAGQVAEAQQHYSEALALMPDGQEAQEGLRALSTPSASGGS
jgi:tetratricopeptide (TPR) repeat protein